MDELVRRAANKGLHPASAGHDDPGRIMVQRAPDTDAERARRWTPRSVVTLRARIVPGSKKRKALQKESRALRFNSIQGQGASAS